MADTRKVGRPTNAERAAQSTRPVRIPVGQARDKLAVISDDGKFYLRWVKDDNEIGGRIQACMDAGYTFAIPSDGFKIAKVDHYKSEHMGSIIRKSAGFGQYLYLMKQPIEYRKEDVMRKEQAAAAPAAQIKPNRADGGYGEVKITRGLVKE